MTTINATPLIPNGQPTALPEAPGIGDLIDVINPLQHIPFVSTLYRAMTGDEISAGARLAGGGIFGGIPGLISSAVNVAFEAGTGEDIGEALMDAAESAVDGVTTPTEQTATYLGAQINPLQSDNGTGIALAEVNYSLMQQAAAAQPEQQVLPESMLPITRMEAEHLSEFADPSLGLQNAYKQTQLMTELDKIAIDLKS